MGRNNCAIRLVNTAYISCGSVERLSSRMTSTLDCQASARQFRGLVSKN